MISPAPSSANVATAKRAAKVRAQRRAGNGTVEDLAAFCCVCERQVVNWKENGVVGHFQIGRNIWFSEDDVAELGPKYHHSGKFSKILPADFANVVRARWREFLGALNADDELRERLALLEQKVFGAPEPAYAGVTNGVRDIAGEGAPFSTSTQKAA